MFETILRRKKYSVWFRREFAVYFLSWFHLISREFSDCSWLERKFIDNHHEGKFNQRNWYRFLVESGRAKLCFLFYEFPLLSFLLRSFPPQQWTRVWYIEMKVIRFQDFLICSSRVWLHFRQVKMKMWSEKAFERFADHKLINDDAIEKYQQWDVRFTEEVCGKSDYWKKNKMKTWKNGLSKIFLSIETRLKVVKLIEGFCR